MIRILGLTLISLFFSQGTLSAQADFRSGYIIENSGDTILGKIDYRGNLLMASKCRFKVEDGAIREYSPDDIAGYRFEDGKFYVSRLVDSRQVFLEYLINGRVKVYYLRDQNGSHYFLEKEGTGLIEIPYDNDLKYNEGKYYEYSSTRHIGFLKYFMQDAPEVQNKISNVKIPEHQSLIRIAKAYHNAVCEDETCVVYEKQLPLIKVNPELFFGAINYQPNYVEFFGGREELTNSVILYGGILGHIWLPRMNEKLFLRTGILRSVVESNGVKESIYKIPIQMEYVYHREIISPKVAYGINFYTSFVQEVAVLAGANVKLHRNVSLSINGTLDFIPSVVSFVPGRLIGYGLASGLFLRF